LEILDISTNQVQRLQGVSTLNRLKDLWVNDNVIESLDHLAEDLQAQRDR
jgi:Leucine-rich repeat (LRR) protein